MCASMPWSPWSPGPPTRVPDRLWLRESGRCGHPTDTLRTDPLLKLVCGRLPESEPDLASQPTFSRLENAISATTCYRLALALLALYLQERERLSGGTPRRILLDLDGTDDPTYGDQESTAYHGYFRQHMYHPLLIFDGDTNQLITAVLRPGNVHGSHGVLAILRRLVERLRTQWPQVRIELRADSGFAVPALYEWCEQEVVPARCSGPKGGVGIRLRLVRQIWAANAVGG